MSTVTTTRTFEYDDEGRPVREVTVVVESTAAPLGPLAVDADGYVWRVNPDGSHSMARVNPDNSPTPLPLTYYAPVAAS